jgi:hypothetical protein
VAGSCKQLPSKLAGAATQLLEGALLATPADRELQATPPPNPQERRDAIVGGCVACNARGPGATNNSPPTRSLRYWVEASVFFDNRRFFSDRARQVYALHLEMASHQHWESVRVELDFHEHRPIFRRTLRRSVSDDPRNSAAREVVLRTPSNFDSRSSSSGRPSAPGKACRTSPANKRHEHGQGE